MNNKAKRPEADSLEFRGILMGNRTVRGSLKEEVELDLVPREGVKLRRRVHS